MGAGSNSSGHRRRTSPGVVGVVDAGSFKTACLIAAVEPGRSPRIAGVAQVPSRGIKSGVVIDLAAAEQTVLAAIAQAESMAGVRLERVTVTVSCGRLASRHVTASVGVDSGTVGREDIQKLRSAAAAYAEREGRRILYLGESGFRLDGTMAAPWPQGLAASRLSADLHAVTVDQGPLRNLEHVIDRCYLATDARVPAPLASGLATTTEEERASGVLVLDIGAGTTGIAAFVEGTFRLADIIPMGGQHISLDIARVLRAPLEEAERIKALYGTMLCVHSDSHESVEYRGGVGDFPAQEITKAELNAIVRGRVSMILGHVADRLRLAGLAPAEVAGIVVTGGTSELPGLVAFIEEYLGRPAREGRPHRISGLPPLMARPAFAGVVGALGATIESVAHPLAAHHGDGAPLGYLGRVGQWLRSGF